MLGDYGGCAARLVADDDVELAGHVDVDHVYADGAGGDHPQARQCSQGLCGPLDGAAGVDDDVGVFRPFELVLHARRAVEVEINIAVGLEAFEVGRSLNLGRVVAGYDEFEVGVCHGVWRRVSLPR